MRKQILLCLVFGAFCFAQGFNAPMQNYIDSLKVEAKKENPSFTDFDAQKGKAIFEKKNVGKNNEMISCQSCHGSNLKAEAMNIFTNKPISALAPSANPARLADVKEVKKWLRRNFKDVFLREGSAQEKGNVLYYLIGQ